MLSYPDLKKLLNSDELLNATTILIFCSIILHALYTIAFRIKEIKRRIKNR